MLFPCSGPALQLHTPLLLGLVITADSCPWACRGPAAAWARSPLVVHLLLAVAAVCTAAPIHNERLECRLCCWAQAG